MLCCHPLFAKKTDDEMLPQFFRSAVRYPLKLESIHNKIIKHKTGTPNEDTWPEHTKLPKWKSGLIRKPRAENIQMEIFKLANC